MSKALNPDPNFVFGNVVAKCYDMFGKLHHIKTILGLISDLDLRCPVFGCSLPFVYLRHKQAQVQEYELIIGLSLTNM